MVKREFTFPSADGKTAITALASFPPRNAYDENLSAKGHSSDSRRESAATVDSRSFTFLEPKPPPVLEFSLSVRWNCSLFPAICLARSVPTASNRFAKPSVSM